jgi:hypothetical protein
VNIFEEATKLGDQRYDREKLLSITSKLVARVRLPNVQDKTKMRGACQHLADALDCSSGTTLQQRLNHFERKIWLKCNAGIGRPCSLWTWGARVVAPTCIVIPPIEWLHDVRVTSGLCACRKTARLSSNTNGFFKPSRPSHGGPRCVTAVRVPVTVYRARPRPLRYVRNGCLRYAPGSGLCSHEGEAAILPARASTGIVEICREDGSGLPKQRKSPAV